MEDLEIKESPYSGQIYIWPVGDISQEMEIELQQIAEELLEPLTNQWLLNETAFPCPNGIKSNL